MLRALLDDLAKQVGIANWLVLVTINIPEPFEEHVGLNLKVIRNDVPKGFGANHNAAAAAAEGKLFLIVNPDIRLTQPNALECIARTDCGNEPTLRAPIVLSPNGEIEDSVRKNLSAPNLFRRIIKKRTGWEANPDNSLFFWIAGMFLIAPLQEFVKIGGFDERFRMYCEDFDLSARWKINGWRIEVLKDITVIHDARRDSHASLRHLRWHLESIFKIWISQTFWRIVIRRYLQRD